jgi:peptidoglycan-associated lipoprotein
LLRRAPEEIDMRGLRLVAVALAVVAAGCATTARQEGKRAPEVDVTGTWRGEWIGYGILQIPREEPATARLRQRGAHGEGRLIIEGASASESVPLALRHAGNTGSRVGLEVSGSEVVMRHELGGQHFVVDFTVRGDRMVGSVRGAEPPMHIVLSRVRPVASAPEPEPVAEAKPEPVENAAEPVDVAAAPAEPAEPEPAQPDPSAAVAGGDRPAPKEFAAMPELRPIHFEFDRAEIGSHDARLLDSTAEWLKANDGVSVLVEGHCDERGTNEYNLALGERRARAVRDYLLSAGIQGDRVTVVTYGEERPLCRDKTEACWGENRRAHFLVKLR